MNTNEEHDLATLKAVAEAIEQFTKSAPVEAHLPTPRVVKPYWRTLGDRQPFRNRGRAA